MPPPNPPCRTPPSASIPSSLCPSVPSVPSGLAAIYDTFGRPSIDGAGRVTAAWEGERLGIFPLPYQLQNPYGLKPITKIYCHRLLGPLFQHIFQVIQERALIPFALEFGGCYNFRTKRSNSLDLSTHSFGIAIDLNPSTNKWGDASTQSPAIVEIFQEHGFEWGGTWKTKDAMHFQYCTGY